MNFGLTAVEIKLINEVFKHYPEIERVKIFGSRALGNYKKNSDIDLVILGELDRLTLAKINMDLDELPLPYLFDIQEFKQITHAELLEHIQRFAQDFYIR